ncbi:hypothetical protein WJX77_005673 [Trebouxia sp. C0004]
MANQRAAVQELLESTTARLEQIKASWSDASYREAAKDSKDNPAWGGFASEAEALSQAVSRLQSALQSMQPAHLTTTSSKAITSISTHGRKRPEGGLTLLNVPKKHKSHHPGQPTSTVPFADQHVLCNAETPTPGAEVAYASASPDLQTASTPLAIAALTAMGMAHGVLGMVHGNSSRPEDRDEEQGSGPSRQLSLQPYHSQNDDPSGPSGSGTACKDGKVLRKCTCKKSRCLKLYCECFAAGVFCDNCMCINCCNTLEAVSMVHEAKKNIIKARPSAFEPKVINATQQHSKGCNCRKSRCLKKYCECFQAGVLCTEACRCLDCHNCGPTGGNTRPPPDSITMAAPTGPPPQASQAGRHQADTKLGRGSTAPQPLRNPVACSVPLNVAAPSHTSICSGSHANQEAPSQCCANGGDANTSTANEESVVEGCIRQGSVMGILQPEQLTAGFAVSCSNPSSDAVSEYQGPVGLISTGLLPLGTIILPANHKLPPGSLVLPQGTSPAGPLCLALPSQLSAHLPSQVLSQLPSQLHTELPASVTAVPSLVKPPPGPSPASLNPRSRHVVTHGRSHRPLGSILQQTAGPDDAGASTESHNNGAGGASQAAEHVTETGQIPSIALESGANRCGSGLLELAEEAVSLAASESTSVQDDATSPPPFGHRAFAHKAARQPFAALQLCNKQSEALPTGTAASADDNVLMTSSSPLPAVAAKQLRSRRRKKSFLAPGKSEVGKKAAGGMTAHNVAFARTGSTTLSCNMPSRAAGLLMGHWESPPIKGKRSLQQHLGAPEAGASMRSGRISKLTERFSQYKSQCSDVRGTSTSPQMECDADLVDVVAALCGLGQQHNI